MYPRDRLKTNKDQYHMARGLDKDMESSQHHSALTGVTASAERFGERCMSHYLMEIRKKARLFSKQAITKINHTKTRDPHVYHCPQQSSVQLQCPPPNPPKLCKAAETDYHPISLLQSTQDLKNGPCHIGSPDLSQHSILPSTRSLHDYQRI